ncbi:MAG TPA: sensor domain-containing diguanylate cyclase [Candidatus Omnitrophica bacterium]|nr:MAG: hypothetical protein DRP61_04230 [Candidatus Omnitrophota bacterium]RKY34154.1 MAG: hypothetical protein DRP69_05465 [Candidatus Omnitrophota bacterium]RKY43953.1 MAG: hypothetical protein DRP80_03695 [Candidatus Omnitrophota bacterium]HEC69174.1 sensor domain-containing diguanylate cyclase [Candidatus Omnitrophota bacterium]
MIKILRKKLFRLKFLFFLSLIFFLICEIPFNFSQSISFSFAVFVFSVSFLGLTLLYLKYRATFRKIKLELEELQEKINSLTSEIKAKKDYLKYLPQSSQRLNFFKELIEELLKLQEVSEIYSFLGQKIKDVFKKLNVFLVYMAEEGELKLIASYKASPNLSVKSKKGDILDYWVLRYNQPLLIEDISADFRFDLEKVSSLKERVINSLILSPLSLGRKVTGVLRAESKDKRSFNFEDLRVFSVISDLASVSIDRANMFKRIQELAIKDGMTGLFLRGYFLDRLKEEMRRSLITQNPLGLILVDIDFFKRLNDKLGHIVGDLVLKKLSDILKEVIGDSGNVISRFGGEEFITFLVSSSKEKTKEVAEILRKRVENTPVIFRRNRIKFTISLGVASFPEDAKFLEDLIKKADQALYKAKREGRNRVCIA